MAKRTIYDVQKAVRAYYQEHGMRPACTDLRTLDRWLGLGPRGTSISRMCDEMGLPPRDPDHGRRNEGRTLEHADAEILAFYETTGRRPTLLDLPPLETWLRNRHKSSVAKACRRLQLPGGNDIARTLDRAEEEILSFFDKHGRRPLIRDLRNLDSWLRVTQDTSVPRLADKLGLPRGRTLRTDENVLATVTAFYEKHGRRPSSRELDPINRWLRQNRDTTLTAYCTNLGYPELAVGGRGAQRLRQDFYWSRSKNLFSIRERGVILRDAECVALENARFKVAHAAQRKVAQTGRKIVHAAVSGFPCDMLTSVYKWTRVYYNPLRGPYFTNSRGHACMSAKQIVGNEVDGKPRLYARDITYYPNVEKLPNVH